MQIKSSMGHRHEALQSQNPMFLLIVFPDDLQRVSYLARGGDQEPVEHMRMEVSRPPGVPDVRPPPAAGNRIDRWPPALSLRPSKGVPAIVP